jgi:hypothetical protein
MAARLSLMISQRIDLHNTSDFVTAWSRSLPTAFPDLPKWPPTFRAGVAPDPTGDSGSTTAISRSISSGHRGDRPNSAYQPLANSRNESPGMVKRVAVTDSGAEENSSSALRKNDQRRLDNIVAERAFEARSDKQLQHTAWDVSQHQLCC